MKPSEFCKSAGLKSLADYIADNFDGNQSAFGRAHGLQRAQVQQYMTAKKPVYVVDNKLIQVIRDLDESKSAGIKSTYKHKQSS